MSLSRFFLSLSLAFALLLSQQGGYSHALRHTLADHKQQDKQAPHSQACDQCASYAQMGGAINSLDYTFSLVPSSLSIAVQLIVAFNSNHILSASARGPPALQRNV